MEGRPETVRVWDPLVRIGHWTLVAAFATAYVTAGDALEMHEWAGYVVAAYLIVRVIWGIVGADHARFTDFFYGPRRVITYLSDMIRHRARRYLGHSPAGGAMVFALLIMLAGTTVTGMAELASSYGEGPLSGLIQQRSEHLQAQASSDAAVQTGGEEPESALQELHELFANVTLVLILFHVAGVVVASILHRENLVLGMVTGRKASHD